MDKDKIPPVNVEKPRFEFIDDGKSYPRIYDKKFDLNVLYIAGSGFGITSQQRELAERIKNWMNNGPEAKQVPYPYWVDSNAELLAKIEGME